MFAGWDDFYLMLGGAAASLIGLLFVVVTLTHSLDRSQAQRGMSIYMTPTVIHFSVVLSIAATAVAPRLPPAADLAVIALAAVVGFGNALWATLDVRVFQPSQGSLHWTDFWLYGVAPTILYVALGGADVALAQRTPWSQPAMAAVLLLLLLMGIRNAWDLVTWIAPGRSLPPEP
jgi:hypothetical protein